MKVMIVEDEQIEALALQKILNQHYSRYISKIIICNNGEDAILKTNKEKIDLIFMDINMPIIDGISASTQIRLKNKDIIIVMITAYSDFEYAKKSIDNHVLDYITKPYSIKTVQRLMSNILESANIIEEDTVSALHKNLQEFILEKDFKGINIYLDQFLSNLSKSCSDSKEFYRIIYLTFQDAMKELSCYIPERERDKLDILAKERFGTDKRADLEKVKIDLFYLIKNMTDYVHDMLDLNQDNIIVQIKRFISLHYGEEINLEELANHVSVSKFYLSRLFKAKTGENIRDYILKVRLEKAKQLLLSNYSISEAAYKTGFQNPAYFSKCFKKEMNISPKEFKNN